MNDLSPMNAYIALSNIEISFSQVVCSKCSPNSLPLLKYGIRKPVKVCTNCYISQLGDFSRSVAGISGQPLQVQ